MAGSMMFSAFEPLLQVARTVEEQGFHAFYTSDHLLGVAGMTRETPVMDPWMLLNAIAMCTSRIKLGVMVTGVTYRHPAVLAKIAATLDIVSGGRMELGIGAAWSKDDHLPFGLPFPPLRERQERLEEAVEIIYGLYTQPRFSHAGKHYQIADAVFEPKPVQAARPPFLIAAVSEKGLDIAARRATLWTSISTPAFAKQCIAKLHEKARGFGRDPSEIVCGQYMDLVFTDSADEARAALDARMKRVLAGNGGIAPQARNGIENESIEEQAMASMLTGDARTLRARIRRYADVGISHMVVKTPRPFDPALIVKFRREVMSEFVD